MPQQLQLNSTKPRKKRVNLYRAGILALAAAWAAAGICAGRAPARAVVSNPATLPLNQSLFFVLDGAISSHAKAGSMVRAHLRDPIVIGGITVAPAGTPVQIEITQTSAAQIGNVDGFADIFFEPLALPDGKTLPLVTPTSHLYPHMSAGAESTRAVTDTVGDIFIPYHLVYHILRKGSDITLQPGTVIRARTGATLALERGAVVVSTPPPLVTTQEPPHPEFVPEPLATPPGYQPPTPKPSPSIHPATTP